MLNMASAFRTTISLWFNRKKRAAEEMMEEGIDENTDANRIPPAPKRMKHRKAVDSNSIYSSKRRLNMSKMPCRATRKRVRRLNRSQVTFKSQLEELVSSTDHSMGWLFTLPLEILHIIFNLLDTNSLVLVSTLSRDLNLKVQEYILSGPGIKKILPYSSSLPHSKNITLFREAGILFRKITVIRGLSKRLKVASQFGEKLKTVHKNVQSEAGMALANKCCGHLFAEYICKWNEYDKLRAYCLLERQSKVNHKITRILKFTAGTLPWQEGVVRQIIRCYLLEPSTNDQVFSFWLAQVLKDHPITHQARLLYILTGPTDNAGFICWCSTCDCSTMYHPKSSASLNEKEKNLSELARALRTLLLNRKEWNMDAIISIFDELTTTPTGWCLNQVATLLMESGTEVCQAILGNRAVNGNVAELSVITYYLAHACMRDDKEKRQSSKMWWFIELIKYIMAMLPNKGEKDWFTTQLINHWQIYLVSLFEDGSFDNETEYEDIHEQFTISLNCLTKLSVTLLKHLTLCN